MARDPADTNAGDEDYVAPSYKECCGILEQKLEESTDASGWKSAIRTAITLYTGFYAICQSEGKEDSKALGGAGSVMEALAVGLLHHDRGLRQRAKSKAELVKKLFQLPMFRTPCKPGDHDWEEASDMTYCTRCGEKKTE